MGTITKVDFKSGGKVLSTTEYRPNALSSIYEKVAHIVGRPNTVLEAVGVPQPIDLQRFFPDATIVKCMYTPGVNPDLARKYISIATAPNGNYDLIIANGIVEEWGEIPFIVLHRWPDLMHKCLNSMVCIRSIECPVDVSVYINVTMRLAFRELVEIQEEDRIALLGRGLR